MSLSPEGDSGGAVAPAFVPLPTSSLSRPPPELAAGAPVEGKDGGGQVSPSLSLSIPIPLLVITCAVVALLMVVAGGPDPASLWVDLVPRRLDPAPAAWGWCWRVSGWSVGFRRDSSRGTSAGGDSGTGAGRPLPPLPGSVSQTRIYGRVSPGGLLDVLSGGT